MKYSGKFLWTVLLLFGVLFNMFVFAAAETDLTADQKDQKIAADMQERIDSLNDLFPITMEDEPEVLEVRRELDSLTAKQRMLVDTTILEKAEAEIAVLRKELVAHVESLILAIPEEITLADEPAILAAREGVDKLSTLERKQVSYTKLENAEAKLRSLKASKAKADEVVNMIDEIGKVTPADAQRIAEARAAYEGLDDTAKALVENLEKLEEAEACIASGNFEETEDEQKDKKQRNDDDEDDEESFLQKWGILIIAGAILILAAAMFFLAFSLRKKNNSGNNG